MSQSLEMNRAPNSWLTFERRNWIALVIVGTMAGFSVGNGHTTQGAISNISNQLGQKVGENHKLTAAAHCEGVRADKATVVARQAIRGALIDSAPIPSPSAIPRDDCPHPAGK